MVPGSGINHGRAFERPSNRHNLSIGQVDIPHPDVHVCPVGRRALRLRNQVEDHFVTPGIGLPQVGVPPGKHRWNHRETGDFGPERLSDIEVVDIDHMTPQLTDSQSSILLSDEPRIYSHCE